MPDVSPPGPADGLDLAYAERGEVVVEHERLGVLVSEPVDDLGVSRGAERNGGHSHRLAAPEDGRTVRAGQRGHFNGQRAYLVHGPRVGTDARENQFPLDLALELVQRRLDLRDGVLGLLDVFGAELAHQFLPDCRQRFLAVHLRCDLLGFLDPLGAPVGHECMEFFRYGLGLEGDLAAAAGLFHQLVDQGDDFLDDLGAQADTLGDDVLGDFFAPEFDHVDALGVPADDQVHLALFELLVGGVNDVVAVDVADPGCCNGSLEGGMAQGQGGRGAYDRDRVRVVVPVETQHAALDLDFVDEVVGEPRTDRPIYHPHGEDLFRGGSAFSLEEPAGYLPVGRSVLAIVHVQWEPADFPGRRGTEYGGQNHRVTVAYFDGTVCLLCEFACLDG